MENLRATIPAYLFDDYTPWFSLRTPDVWVNPDGKGSITTQYVQWEFIGENVLGIPGGSFQPIIGGISRYEYRSIEETLIGNIIICWKRGCEALALRSDNPHKEGSTPSDLVEYYKQNSDTSDLIDRFENQIRKHIYLLRLHQRLGVKNGWVASS